MLGNNPLSPPEMPENKSAGARPEINPPPPENIVLVRF
jgi:hypothetical protein